MNPPLRHTTLPFPFLGNQSILFNIFVQIKLNVRHHYGDVYLSLRFEDIAAEHIAFLVSCYVTEYLQVL